jgi:hypothetical protein
MPCYCLAFACLAGIALKTASRSHAARIGTLSGSHLSGERTTSGQTEPERSRQADSGVSSFTPGCDGAGNCYIASAASGRGDGSSWVNAYRGFGNARGEVIPSAMRRGATYWIAAGAYGGVRFSTPDRGAAAITIKGATASSHGPATDWNANFAGEAIFGKSIITTDYWIFKGQDRGSDWRSGYTLRFWNRNDPAGAAVVIGGNHDLTFDYVEIEGTGMTNGAFPNNATADRCTVNGCGKWFDNGIYASGAVSRLYVGHSYVHHTGNTQFQMNAAVSDHAVWEYNWVSYNHTGQNGGHDEAYSLYASNVIIRYNVFQDIAGSGVITTAGAGQPPLKNWTIYGNIFFWDPAYAAFNGKYYLAICDNGIVDFLGESMSGSVSFTNNTIAGMYNPEMDVQGAAASTMAISGNNSRSGGSICGSGSCPAVTIENNLWYGDGYVYGDSAPYCQVVSKASCIQDYNASYRQHVPSGSNWKTGDPPGPHDYNVSSATVPFVDAGRSTIDGFELVNPDPFRSHPGIPLISLYNIDMRGMRFGADGVWDRGALQFPEPAPSSQRMHRAMKKQSPAHP